MSKLTSIEECALTTVTGGATVRSSSPSNDIASQISSLADSVKAITNKTSGFSNSQFLLLAALAFANRGSNTSVVYYSGPRRWW